jgi:formylglycine-generating enzyme required for sulfatase activity
MKPLLPPLIRKRVHTRIKSIPCRTTIPLSQTLFAAGFVIGILLIGILLLTGCRNPATNHPKDDVPAARTYSVSTTAAQNGRIISKPRAAAAGTEVVLQISPDPGYKLRKDSLKIKSSAGEILVDEHKRSFILPSSNVTVTGEFEALPEKNYSVSALPDADKHGIIIPHPEFGPEGTPVFFSIIPDEGYRYIPGSLRVDDTAVNDITRTFVLPGRNVKVDAAFGPAPAGDYTIRVNNSANGRIFAKPETGSEGADIYFQVIADPGYVLKTGTLKYSGPAGEHLINETLRSIAMPQGHILVSGEFEKLPAGTYSIGIENTANGRIFTESKYGTAGNKINLQIYPDSGYTLKEGTLKYKTSTSVADISGADLSFEMPEDNIIIQGEFTALEPDLFSVQVGRFNNGKITAFPEYGKKDTSIFLRVKPDAGYQLKEGSLRYVDSAGQETVIGEENSFILPAGHVKIKAEFEVLSANVYTVYTADIPNGDIIATPASGKEFTAVSAWVMPKPGYYYKKGTLKYKLLPSNAEYSIPDGTRVFKLNASHVEIRAEFLKTPENNFTVRVNPADHGMIFPRQDYGYSGQRIELIILPDPGYQIKPGSLQYQGSGGNIVKFNGTETGFSMPREHTTVFGEFEAIKYTANVDTSIQNGAINVNPRQGTIGTLVNVEVAPKNGYRLVPNSLKYRTRNNVETAINEKTQQFSMPPADITIIGRFEPYSALGDLKVNDRPVRGLTGGKTDYTVWIPHGESSAKITFISEPGITVSPDSGETINLDPLAKKSMVFTVSSLENKVKTDYTITVIRELIPTREVPEGSFQRDNNSNNISIVSSFRMGEREVTQEEWYKVMGFDRGTGRNTLPAHNVSWYEAVVFCNRLSILEGKTPVYVIGNTTDPGKWGKIPDLRDNATWYVSSKWDADGYRLPTEMEWQWAAMGADSRLAGKTNTAGYGYVFAGYLPDRSAGDVAWYKNNSGGKIHPVGEKAPNDLGLYDISGNVMEWCWDWVNGNYLKNYGVGGKQTNFRGGDNMTNNKMRRGGSYLNDESDLVLNYRGNENGPRATPPTDGDPRTNDEYAGLRIVYRN